MAFLTAPQHPLAQSLEARLAIRLALDQLQAMHMSFNWSLGTNCQLHLITRMVNRASSSLIPFIPCLVKPFLCCLNALRGREERIFFLDPESQQVRSLPLAWTNLALPDPFVVVASGKAVLRWSDLHQLAQFLESKQIQSQEGH